MRELLDLAVRWVHVIAAIMWIGNSLLFNWLDRNLEPAEKPRARSGGSIWLLHSGGFYFAEKTFGLDPGVDVRSVHWFKWQAYTTWLSGAALLAIVYWHSARSLLVASDSALLAGLAPEHRAGAGILISIAVLAGGWLLYDAIWSTPLRHRPRLTAALCFGLLLGLAWLLLQLFTGRAAFLHVGALLATLMAGNVHRHIMPAQREFVAGIARGVTPDDRLPARAKLRSIHNNYITFPVVVLMLSGHFPSLYAHDNGWLAVAVLVLGGAGVRHILNTRYTQSHWKPALALFVTLVLGSLYPFTRPRPVPLSAATGTALTDEQAFALVQKRCTVCHSASPADASLGAPPAGVAFDTPRQVRALAPRIEARAVFDRTMPLDNRTNMTEEERALLGRWLLELRSGRE